MSEQKRPVEVVVLSDVHLGTYGCHAKEVLQYLRSIEPGTLILNGDIIDIWQFKKRYWPQSHMQVIKHLMGLMTKGTPIYYVTGNHDEMLRKFTGFKLGSLRIVNKVMLQLDEQVAWVFHGDVFDVTMQHSKWLAKLGGAGYDMLIVLNRFVNWFSEKVLGRGKLSLSKKVKDSVKSAVKFINDFENTAAGIAIDKGYDYVVCGHIHQPTIRTISNENGSVEYLNSGDWVENLTALEYNQGEWKIYSYLEDQLARNVETLPAELPYRNNKELFAELVAEFNMART